MPASSEDMLPLLFFQLHSYTPYLEGTAFPLAILGLSQPKALVLVPIAPRDSWPGHTHESLQPNGSLLSLSILTSLLAHSHLPWHLGPGTDALCVSSPCSELPASDCMWAKVAALLLDSPDVASTAPLAGL